MRYRQIHLDFHTSEYIDEIAKDFNKEDFANTVEKANVDSITCFARCHHGWLYYPSNKYQNLIHPNLENKNLLLEQIEACHKKGINVPIYTTIQWDAIVMREHPEWLAIDAKGEFIDTQNVGDPHFYHTICLNSEYRNFFKDHLQDIIDVVGTKHVDGFFMDILFQVDCNCKHCKSEMRALSMDTENKIERLKYATIMMDEFKEEISNFIRSKVPNASIFYNSSHVGPKYKNSFKDYSHLELESLPSGGWGYDHFPATSRYARTLGKELIGMTGKFHTYWGDFHSLKMEHALEFECFQMLSAGAGCSIGDQLHPFGKLSQGSYDLIGKVYSSVKKKEAYCIGAHSKTEIAILNPEEFYQEGHNLGISPSLIGAVRVLNELSYQFDIIDTEQELSKYKVVILPDCIYYNENLETVIKNYVSNGGRILASYDSCIKKDDSENIYGIKYLGNSPYYREFVMPNDIIGKHLPKEEFVLYTEGYDVEPVSCEVLMDKIKPFFNREGKTFCSHQHAPSSGIKGYPEVVKNGDVIYFAHPIFSLYRKNLALWCKEMIADALEILLEDKLVSHNGPTSVMNSLNELNGDLVLHILHYITEKRSEDIYTISDKIPLYGTKYRVYIGDKKVSKLFNVVTKEELLFEINGSYIEFTIEKIYGHEMLCIKF